MDKFISRTTGSWFLQSGTRANLGEKREGSYVFDCGSGILRDGSGEEVGKFSCDPIADIGLCTSIRGLTANLSLECISITDSEIMAEIQNERNEGAYFVLPSQLNGAEYPGPSTIVDKVNDYKFDNTGGPRGQLAVHPAAAQFIIDNAASERCPLGINAIDEILAGTGDVFTLVNGYLKLPMPETSEDARHFLDTFHAHLHTLRPLVMSAVQACGLTTDKMAFSTATHKVNLIYASAVPFSAYLNRPTTAIQKELHLKVAEAVLVAQYYGALKIAADRCSPKGRAKIFLMPLGGGVFNNPWEIIAKSIALAVELLDSVELDKLDINVLTWNGNRDEKSKMCRLLAGLGKLKVRKRCTLPRWMNYS